MMRSLYAGVAGLRAHQTRMDVVGNNIANVNTVGFKKGRVTFKEMLSQMLQAPSEATTSRGGINALQVGMGVDIGTIDNNFAQGSLQYTGMVTDMAINGSGFFVVNDGSRNLFSRAGNFNLDSQGYLVHGPNGYRLQGWNVGPDGKLEVTRPVTDMRIPIGDRMSPAATSYVIFDGNLNAGAVRYTDVVQGLSAAALQNNVSLGLSEEEPNTEEYIVGDGTNGLLVRPLVSRVNIELRETGVDGEQGVEVNGNQIVVTYLNTENTANDIRDLIADNSEAMALIELEIAGDGDSTVAGDHTFDELIPVVEITGDANTGYTVTVHGIDLDPADPAEDPTTLAYVRDALAACEVASGLVSLDITDSDIAVAELGTFELLSPLAEPYYESSIAVYDSFGSRHEITLRFEKTAQVGVNEWTWTISGDTVESGVNTSGTVVFSDTGTISEGGGTQINIVPLDGAQSPFSVDLDFSQLTQYTGAFSVDASELDGNEMGFLQSFTVDSRGVVQGVYTNGLSRSLGRVGLANFNNEGGLTKEGETLFSESANSGMPQVGLAGEGGRGSIQVASLEMSNVDMAEEFSDMIITQRGYQVNSKIISTADQMLQELLNLKR